LHFEPQRASRGDENLLKKIEVVEVYVPVMVRVEKSGAIGRDGDAGAGEIQLESGEVV
jgi:hypothetical protein